MYYLVYFLLSYFVVFIGVARGWRFLFAVYLFGHLYFFLMGFSSSLPPGIDIQMNLAAVFFAWFFGSVFGLLSGMVMYNHDLKSGMCCKDD